VDDPRSTSPKGAQTAARILAAATAVLARDGMSGATLGRIATEAGVDKRNVTYYYGSREALLVRVVQAVAERIRTGAEAALEAAAPGEATIVDTIWDEIVSQPEFVRAYITLLGGGGETPDVQEALAELKRTYVVMIARQIARARSDHAPREDDAQLATLIVAVLRGLVLEWAEAGDSPALRGGLGRVNALLG
jgi:AcrR family transcriptional regulator